MEQKLNGLWMSWISVRILIRTTVAVIFIVAASSKLIAPSQFAHSVSTFRVLPESIISLFANGFSVLEMMLGLAMLFGFGERIVGNIAFYTYILVLLMLVQADIRGFAVSCGCFGTASIFTAYSVWHLLFVIALICACYYLIPKTAPDAMGLLRATEI